MKINEYNQMMKYLTRPKRSEYEQVAMVGNVKKGADLLKKLLKKGDVKKGETPKTNLKKVRTKVQKDREALLELAKNEQIPVEQIDKLLSGEIAQVKRTAGRGVIKLDKDGNPYVTETFTAKIDPSTLSTEDLIEFRKTNRAGKGQFTNAEAIIARLENTIKETSPDDETYEYVTTTFPNFIKELKAKPELANNENVWNNLMSDLPENQRFVKYDDGTVDFQTKRPSHTFKLRKDLDTDRRGVAPEATSEEKLYDEYIYYRDELGNFEGSFDDFIVARRKAGSVLAEETPLSTGAVKRKQNAEGGVIGGGMIEGDDLGSRTGFAEPLPTNIQNWLKETFPEIKFEFSPRKKYGLVLGDEGYKTVYDATQNKLKNPNFVYKTKAEASRETGEKTKEKARETARKKFLKKKVDKPNYSASFNEVKFKNKKQEEKYIKLLKEKFSKPMGSITNAEMGEKFGIPAKRVEEINRILSKKLNLKYPESMEFYKSQGKLTPYQMAAKKASAERGEITSELQGSRISAVEQSGKRVHHIMPFGGKEKITAQGLALIDDEMNRAMIDFEKPILKNARRIKEIYENQIKYGDPDSPLPKNIQEEIKKINMENRGYVELAKKKLPKNYRGLIGYYEYEPTDLTQPIKRKGINPNLSVVGIEGDDFVLKENPEQSKQLAKQIRETTADIAGTKELQQIKQLQSRKPFYNPNQLNMGFGFLDDITTQVMEDVARGAVKYGPDMLRGAGKIIGAEVGAGLLGAPFDVAEGRSRNEVLLNIGTFGAGVPIKDELERNEYLESFSSGLSKDYQMAKTKQAIASGQARGYEQMNPEFSVLTDREQLALDKANEWTTTVLQPRLQEGIKSFQQYQKGFEESESDFGLGFASGGRVEMAGGGIAALKALINFLGKGRGKKGSELLKEVNPKKYGTVLENLMLPDDKKMVGGFRVEYLESLLDTIKNDKAMLDRMKEMPVDQQESFFNMINQGANRGRLDVYKKINPDEAILEIEQMIKNLKTKDMSPEEIKRSLNALGGRVGFEKGGSSSDKKKTTPALDKPTISIDPNAPTDPAKRDTLKGAGILGAGVVAGKLGLLEFGPKAIKTVKKVTSDLKEQGMPDFFYEIVEAVKLFGKKEKYKTGILKEDDVYTYRNPKTKELITVEEGPREVRIEFSSDTGNPSTIGVRKGIPDKSTKGKTPPDEYFEQSQIRYPEYGGGDYKDIVDEVAGGYEDLPRIVEDIIDID